MNKMPPVYHRIHLVGGRLDGQILDVHVYYSVPTSFPMKSHVTLAHNVYEPTGEYDEAGAEIAVFKSGTSMEPESPPPAD